MGKGNSQQSQAESSVKRILKKMKRKDKSQAVEMKKPVESPKPVSPVVATPKKRKRRMKKRRESFPRRLRSYSDYFHEDDPEAMPYSEKEKRPKCTWVTTSQWPESAVTAAEAFLDRYAEMGYDGMREEYKKEVDGYKYPQYADTFWKANPTKNRDKDQMTCLDGSRVEFEDKKRYINANWLYDTQLVPNRYILTQIPIVPHKEGDVSTLDEFWEMIHKNECLFIIWFRELRDDGPNEREKGLYGKVLKDKFYPVVEDAPIELSNYFLMHKSLHGIRMKTLMTEPHRVQITPTKCPVEDNHKHEKMHKCFGDVKGCVNRFLSVCCTATHEWSELSVLDELYNFYQIQGDDDDPKEDARPIVLMDDFSGTSRASIFVAIDVLGCLLFRGHVVNIFTAVHWMRKCRNLAIRNGDEYVFIFRCLVRQLGQYPMIKMTAKACAMYNEMIGVEKKIREEAEAEARKIQAQKEAEAKAKKDEADRKEREKAEQERLREASEKKKKKKKLLFF